MTDRTNLLNELQVLVNTAVSEVTTKLTGEVALDEKDFRLKFITELAESIREKGSVWGKYSDIIFYAQMRLKELGWEVVEAPDSADFNAYADYGKKQYAIDIPKAYYAANFFSRLVHNIEGGNLNEGIYKYAFLSGEYMKTPEDQGSGDYTHLFMESEKLHPACPDIAGIDEFESSVTKADEPTAPERRVISLSLDPDDEDPLATAHFLVDEAFKIARENGTTDVVVQSPPKTPTFREINERLKDGSLSIEQGDDTVVDATEQFQERQDAAFADRLDASINELEEKADAVAAVDLSEGEETMNASSNSYGIQDKTTTVSGASYIDQTKDIRHQFEAAGWTFPSPASLGEETILLASLAEKQIHVQLHDLSDTITLFVALDQLRKHLLAPVSEKSEGLAEAKEALGREIVEVSVITGFPQAFTNDTDETTWTIIFS